MTRFVLALTITGLLSIGLFAGCGEGGDTDSATGVVETFLHTGDADERCDLTTDSESGEDICDMYSQVPAYPDATATEVECSNPDENRWVCVEASVREGTHTALFLVSKTDDGYSIGPR